MSTINWDLFKCRCSGIKKILSVKPGTAPISEVGLKRIAELEARTKPMTPPMQLEYAELITKRDSPPKLVLSDTCIEYLMEVYAWETEGMIPVSKESMDILSMSKGKKQEAQAAALLGFIDDAIYKIHKERIGNEFLSGEVDLYTGESIYEAVSVADIKNSWDYPTFLKKINNGLESGQQEQVQGYGDITGAKILSVANCLVDCTEQNIDEVKFRVSKKFGAATIESPEFLEEWKKWEKSMLFSHIEPHKRVFKIQVEPFSISEQQKVYDRVKFCREWLWKFDETYEKLNKYIPLSENSENIEKTEVSDVVRS